MYRNEKTIGQETATFAGGCFWCLEAVYDTLNGVTGVESGYTGGKTQNPSYEEVCSGNTGHAEVVQITFDPTVLSFKELLLVFFSIHDPTTLNRQGNDVGTQYRSAIYYHDIEQRRIAQELMSEMASKRIWINPLVTEVEPLEVFYPAEDYHRDYYQRNQNQPYCQVVIAPKMAKFRKEYADRLK